MFNPLITDSKPLPNLARQSQAHPDKNKLPTLTVFIRKEIGKQAIRQSEFCRIHEFDQGLMSKLMNGIVTRISLETAIRLAKGLDCSVSDILIRSGQTDLLDLFKDSIKHEAKIYRTQKAVTCKKCSEPVGAGVGLVNARITLPDFPGDAPSDGCTQTLSPNAELVDVLKCEGCGHSFTV